MKWDDLNLHLENLLPGVLASTLAYMLLPLSIADKLRAISPPAIREDEFLLATCFLATAYICGVFCVAISRLVLDRLSEMGPRPLMIRLLSRGSLVGVALRDINENYRRSIASVLHSGNQVIIDEVEKRRQRGRLARTSLIPSILFVIAATSDLSVWIRLVWILATVSILLVCYSYIEFTIYEECQLQQLSDEKNIIP
ncbi:MAG: hypothetical protein HYV27_09330 [Candidatus Hydrogenedentes bacterium]|nr:hypothetical protein [Candidatus Hydrogenedentota bacterium]